jgi:formylglycine-generating enzyme required for sulfatase activity
LEDSSIQQRPNLVGNFVRSPILVIPTKVPLLSAPFGEKEIAAVITALGRSKGMKPVIKNDIGMEFRLIPAGKFTMGSPETEKDRGDDEHQHEVEITRSFYMGMYEVTQSQWERVMGHNPSAFSLSGKLKADVEGINTGNFPVESVSWEEANTFLDRMNSRFGISGFRYCLPTEAEWEYACRGGSETTFHFGDEQECKFQQSS